MSFRLIPLDYQRDTTFSGWKFQLHNLAVKGLNLNYVILCHKKQSPNLIVIKTTIIDKLVLSITNLIFQQYRLSFQGYKTLLDVPGMNMSVRYFGLF